MSRVRIKLFFFEEEKRVCTLASIMSVVGRREPDSEEGSSTDGDDFGEEDIGVAIELDAEWLYV